MKKVLVITIATEEIEVPDDCNELISPNIEASPEGKFKIPQKVVKIEKTQTKFYSRLGSFDFSEYKNVAIIIPTNVSWLRIVSEEYVLHTTQAQIDAQMYKTQYYNLQEHVNNKNFFQRLFNL